jgi:cobalt/nickel transport system permease protein
VHIPDGYLSPATCAVLGAGAVPAWAVSAARLKRLGTREVPLLALGSAFSFVVMMFNVPAPGGTTGHAVGSGLVAVLLGPAAAVVTTTVALAIQALLFGDGGLLTFGANCFNMAVIMPVVTYAVFRALTASNPDSPRRRAWGAAVGAYFGINAAALATAVEVGLQPALAHAPDGTPLYCPYGLGASVPGMMIPHLVLFGLIEAVATGGVVNWADFTGFTRKTESSRKESFALGWAALGVLCLLSPVGLLAAGDAWGEWAPEELQKRLGYKPPGLERLADLWKGLLPDYNVAGGDEAGPKRALVYVASALLGVLLVGGIAWAVGRLATRGPASPESGSTP